MGSIRQAPSGRWQARYRDPNGRLRSRTFATKTEARRFLERTGADQQRGEWVDPSLGRVTFGEWADAWSETIVDLRPATIDQNLRLLRLYVLPAFGDVPLAKITPLDVRGWLAKLMADPKLSPSTGGQRVHRPVAGQGREAPRRGDAGDDVPHREPSG